jgi:hypothetical protein
MTRDELIWAQIAETHEYLRFVAEQGMTWFAWGVGINAAGAWVVLADKVTLHTCIVPLVFAIADALAGAACLLLPLIYYQPASVAIQSLMQKLTVAGDTGVVEKPAFPLRIWRNASLCMAGFLGLLAAVWLIALFAGELIGRNPPV